MARYTVGIDELPPWNRSTSLPAIENVDMFTLVVDLVSSTSPQGWNPSVKKLR